MKSTGTLGLTGLFLVAAFAAPSKQVLAQSLPSGCVPAGSTYECLAVLAGPYDYTHNTCGVHEYRATEAESFQDELNEWSGVCDLQTVRNGWYTTSTPIGFCGVQSNYPKFNWGIETGNVSNYTFTYRDTCTSAIKQQSNNAVIRDRNAFCPQGYGLYTSGGISRCRRAVANQEPQKNLGKPRDKCCGNPIDPAIANKYQEETDYQGASPDGLILRRYYNSALEWPSRQTFYSVYGQWSGSWLGYSQFGKLAMCAEPPWMSVQLCRNDLAPSTQLLPQVTHSCERLLDGETLGQVRGLAAA